MGVYIIGNNNRDIFEKNNIEDTESILYAGTNNVIYHKCGLY